VYTDEFEGDEVGIWAVDPRRPEGDDSDRIRLRATPADPLDWSEDGTKLLISEQKKRKRARFFLLNADGTETTVVRWRENTGGMEGASLSPEGSQVVYAWVDRRYDYGYLRGSGIYVVGADGGRPHLLRRFGRLQLYSRPHTPAPHGWIRTWLTAPAFSPDGRKIAYFDGMGDWGNGLRVMNADGSHVRVLIDSDAKVALDISHSPLVWSPDGSRLAFQGSGGIWVIGADGSGLRKLIPGGRRPSWSPDGSRIAYQSEGPDGAGGPLRIADADDGRTVETFTYGQSGPWNPLEPASG
jgi:Tol biopolymer transport system component